MTELTDPRQLPRSSYVAYLTESMKPVVCLVFILPILVAYHVGLHLLQDREYERVANGADILLQRFLSWLGLGGPLITGAFLVGTLLVLQQWKGAGWRVRPWVLGVMVLESLLFALPPFFLGFLVQWVALSITWEAVHAWGMHVVLSLGAGVYEEFLFRMLLMGGLFWVFRRVFGAGSRKTYICAMLLQAVLFSLCHHLPGSMEPFHLTTFVFRIVAGLYFGYIYLERGIGIAVGAHACYDVIAVTLNGFR